MSLHLEDAIAKLRDIEIRSPYIFYGVIIFILCYWWKSTALNNPSGLPVIGRRWYEIGNGKARQRIRDDCLGIVRSCLQKVCHVPILVYYRLSFQFLLTPEQHGDAFYLYTDSRYRLILSGKYVDMLRNEKRLDFITALADVSEMSFWRNQKLTWKQKLVNGVHGFEPMESMTSDKKILHAVTKHSLNRHLG